ncbi:MAG: aminopeptidase P family protein [Firmicutes bacterium]|nr:aminopeptidase P family protein [Bacillota bacterium]
MTLLEDRRQRLCHAMADAGHSHLFLAPGASFTYFTSLSLHASERLTLFGCDASGRTALVLPQLELDSARDAAVDAVFSYADEEGPARAMASLAVALGLTPESTPAVEETHLRLFEAQALRECGASTLREGAGAVMALRLYKSAQEIAVMQRAARVTDAALEATLPLLRVGMTELEIAAELEYQLKKQGSQSLPFGTIAGAGARGALPHSVPGETKVQIGDLLVLDFGAIVEGYVADTTRTVAFGDPGAQARTVYETVQRAQAAAVEAVKPGKTAGDIDRVARSVISDAGYGPYFTHRTGHGLGLETHEYPSIMAGSTLPLIPGMVFTIEPGIYLPGQFGVRIEDDVVVTDDSVLVLTQMRRDLIIL